MIITQKYLNIIKLIIIDYYKSMYNNLFQMVLIITRKSCDENTIKLGI